MGNREAKNTNRMIDRAYTGTNRGYGNFTGAALSNLDAANAGNQGLRNQISTLYGNIAQGPSVPGMQSFNNTGWFNLPGSMRKDTQTGELVPNENSDFNVARRGFSNIANTGGFDRGNLTDAISRYRTFSDTGGFGTGEEDAIRRSASAPVSAYYQGLKNDLARRQNLQGGYLPGFDESMAEMGREASRRGYEASTDAEARLAGMRQQGRLTGLGGLADVSSRVAGLEQQGRLAGTQGLFGLGATELDAQLNMAGMFDRNRLAGAEGLSRLYGTAPAETAMWLDASLSGLGGGANAASNFLGMRAQYNPNRSVMDRIMQGAGIGGGILGAYLGR